MDPTYGMLALGLNHDILKALELVEPTELFTERLISHLLSLGWKIDLEALLSTWLKRALVWIRISFEDHVQMEVYKGSDMAFVVKRRLLETTFWDINNARSNSFVLSAKQFLAGLDAALELPIAQPLSKFELGLK